MLSQKQFAERIGVTRQTVHNWDKNGLFPSRKTSTGKIYYTEEDVQKYYNGGTSNEHNSTNNSSEQ